MGTELDTKNDELYFELNIKNMSNVPAGLQEERLAYILKKFELDKEQQKVFEKSTTGICAGVHDEIGLVETARVKMLFHLYG